MIHAAHLRTEYLENPVGIDIATPRFFWTVEGAKKQTACQVTAVTNDQVIWDSGKVVTSSMRMRYSGPELKSRQRVDWSVTLWDEHDVQIGRAHV